MDENTEDEKNWGFEAEDKYSDKDSKACFDSEPFDDVLGDTCTDDDATEYVKDFEDDPKAILSSNDHVDDDGDDSKAGIIADDFFVDAESMDEKSFDDFTEFEKNSDDELWYILIIDSFEDVIDDFTEFSKNSDDEPLDVFNSDVFDDVSAATVDDENSDDDSKDGFVSVTLDDVLLDVEAMNDISIDDLSTCDKLPDEVPLDDFISDAFDDVVSDDDSCSDDDSKAGFVSDGFVDVEAVDDRSIVE